MTHAEDIYFFSHALLQQAAYQLSPLSVRAHLHSVAAELLAKLPEPPSADIALHARLAQEGVTQFDDRLLELERYWVGRAGEAAEAAYRIQDAIDYYERLAEIHADGSPEQAKALCKIVDLLMQLDRAFDALPWADRAVNAATRHDDPQLLATALSALGAATRDGTRNAESSELYLSSVSLFRQVGDLTGLAKSLLGLAGSLWTKGVLADAETVITEACEIAESLHDVKVKAGAWMNRLGIVLQAKRFPEAEAAIERLSGIVGDTPDPALKMRLHAFRAYAMDVMQRTDEARVEYDRTIELATELGNKAEVARCQTNLATLDAKEMRYAQARQRHVEAECVARELGDLRIAAYACAGQASVDEILGDYRSSLERNYAAIRIAEQLRMDVILPEWQLSAGLIHAELGDADTARRILTKFSSPQHPGLEAARLSALAHIEAADGNLRRARSLAQQAQDTLPNDYEVSDPLPRQWVARASKLLN